MLAKSHVPDLAKVMPPFNVESIEKTPEELIMHKASRRKVEFESIEFNKRFLATVPSEYDPVALREMFSPGFLEWVTTMDNEIEFGVSEQQLWFLWRLRERTRDELEAALDNGGRAVQAHPQGGRGDRHPHLPRRAPGTPGSSPSRTARAAALDAFALAVAPGRLVEADRLGEVAPVARQLALVRELEAADELVRDHGPAAVGPDEIAADLEVLLPGEVGAVRVRGDADAARA